MMDVRPRPGIAEIVKCYSFEKLQNLLKARNTCCCSFGLFVVVVVVVVVVVLLFSCFVFVFFIHICVWLHVFSNMCSCVLF